MIHRFAATVGEADHEVTVEALDGGSYRVTVDGRVRVIDARRIEGSVWSLLPQGGGAARLVDVDGRSPDFVVGTAGRSVAVKLVEGKRAKAAQLTTRAQPVGPQPVRAPMPGKIVKVLVQPGDVVKAGQGVIIVEAMKMENELRAAQGGTVGEVSAKEGQTVEAGQVLATIG